MRHESLLNVALTWTKITAKFESTYRLLQMAKKLMKNKCAERKKQMKRSGDRIYSSGIENLKHLAIVGKMMYA